MKQEILEISIFLKIKFFSICMMVLLPNSVLAHEDISNRCTRLTGSDSCLFYSVGLHQLLSIPNAFDNKVIRVRGAVNFDNDGVYLTMYQKDYDNLDLNSAVVIKGMTKEQHNYFKGKDDLYMSLVGKFNVWNINESSLNVIGFIEVKQIIQPKVQ